MTPLTDAASSAQDALDMDVVLRRGTLDLHLRLRTRASRIAIVGPSGAGKTTCLRMLAGLEPDVGGHIHLFGDTWLDTQRGIRRPPWTRGVGWAPQDAWLFPHRSVRGNLGYAGRASARELRHVAEWLELTPLLQRRPRHISGGERQRVALGRALLARPRLLLLDEPFAALDPPLRARLGTELQTWCSQHEVPLILVSHDEADIGRLVDEQHVLHAGRLQPFDAG